MTNKNATFRKTKISIPAKSTATVSFNATKPNYFQIGNNNAATIYLATESIPSKTSHDCSINPNSSKLQAYPYGFSQIYIYNDGAVAITVQLTSFEWDFDPAVLAMGEVSVDLSSATLSTNTAIAAFNTALPTGYNRIGSVDIAAMPNPSIAAGANKIGSVDIVSMPKPSLAAGSNKIGSVDVITMPSLSLAAGVNKIGSVDITSMPKPLLPSGFTAKQVKLMASVTAAAKTVITNVFFIDFFSNDSDADIVLEVQRGVDPTMSIKIKAGESLNSVDLVDACKVSFSSTVSGKAFRFVHQIYQ